ncbi:MAG: DinB family protein [Phycisphaerales bacterium]
MLTRFLDGFTDETRTRQAPGLPNHVAWVLGHCALTMGRLAERAGGPSIPSDFFIEGVGGDGRRGNLSRFDADAVSPGSSPTDEPELWPSLEVCRECFDEAVETLADTLASASDEGLADSISWGNIEYPLRDLGIRLSLHNALHAGQIADLRRALGMGRIAK